ncbi:MAG: TrkA family potassium uptake protein [Planctomycetes bacterium]|nr:TrkA family potassium uptake protein [Planctomycetota bacterium]
MRRFAVIGLGRFGQRLASSLTMNGAEVIAIDRDSNQVDAVRDQVGHAVRLDSTDVQALRAQAIDKVDVAIVGIGQGTAQGFEAAVLTVVNLRQIGVPQIYARAENLTAGEIFAKVGAAEIIYPEFESAERWAYRLIAPQIDEKIDFAPGYSLARIEAPPSFDGRTVMDLQLRQKYNVNLVLIRRNGKEWSGKGRGPIINVPTPDTVIREGDILVLAGSDEDLARLPQD